MQTIKQFPSWFLKQKLSGKLFIGCSGLFFLCCLCSIPIRYLNPSTPIPTPNQDIAAAVYTQAFETAWASLPTSNTTPLPLIPEFTLTPLFTPIQEFTLPPLFTPTLEFTPLPPLPSNASCIPKNNPREIALVIGIIDGDTIDVQMNSQTYRVRYIGIDTPENGQPNYWPATGQNQTLVYSKNVTMVKDVSETDRYGRILRYVLVGDTFVNYELVKLGFASAYRYPPDTSCADQFETAQNQAQTAQLGIWQPIPTQAISQRDNSGSNQNCSPAYPTVCIPPPPPDLDCKDVPYKRFQVLPPDPHNFDRDADGIGCES